MEEIEEEIDKALHDKFNKDLVRLMHFFRSMNYGVEEIKIIITLLLGTLYAVGKYDEEDIRDIFRGVSNLKDRIVFK